MDHTQRTTVGSRPVMLTRLGYGGAPIGNLLSAVTDTDAQAALQAAWAAGIRYFDTAPWYGLGLSEHRVGQFLRGKPKSEYTLSTKVGRLLKPCPPRSRSGLTFNPWVEALQFDVRFDYSYNGIIRAYEDSLQRLGLPEVDMLFIHDLDRHYHVPEGSYQARLGQLSNGGYAALRDLRADGKIGAIGAGVNSAGTITDMLDRFDLDVCLVAGPYTLVNQEILSTELARCLDAGVRVVIGAAFFHGLLATGVRYREPGSMDRIDPASIERIRALEEICDRWRVALPAAALQFPAAHPAVAALVFGGTGADQVGQAVNGYDTDIPTRFWDDLKDRKLLPATAPVPAAMAPSS